MLFLKRNSTVMEAYCCKSAVNFVNLKRSVSAKTRKKAFRKASGENLQKGLLMNNLLV